MTSAIVPAHREGSTVRMWFGALIYTRVLQKASASQVQTKVLTFVEVSERDDPAAVLTAQKELCGHAAVVADGWDEREHKITQVPPEKAARMRELLAEVA